MTRDEWKNYKDFDELRREMSGGFAGNNLFGADMTHLDVGRMLNTKKANRPQGGAPDGSPRAE